VLTNVSAVSRRVTVKPPASSSLSVTLERLPTGAAGAYAQVAPGMSCSYVVRCDDGDDDEADVHVVCVCVCACVWALVVHMLNSECECPHARGVIFRTCKSRTVVPVSARVSTTLCVCVCACVRVCMLDRLSALSAHAHRSSSRPTACLIWMTASSWSPSAQRSKVRRCTRSIWLAETCAHCALCAR
jgi:hypothetical protein